MRKIDEFNAEDRIDLSLLENSTFFLNGEIEENSIGQCIRWILYENFNFKEDKILTIYINSTGGDLYCTFALIDVMRHSRIPIRTIGLGSVMSAAFLIFASGADGERYCGKHTSLMCHQFSSGSDGKYHDLKAEMKETELLNQKMVNILKDATGLAPGIIKKKLLPASDVYLTADEVIELGIADHLF